MSQCHTIRSLHGWLARHHMPTKAKLKSNQLINRRLSTKTLPKKRSNIEYANGNMPPYSIVHRKSSGMFTPFKVWLSKRKPRVVSSLPLRSSMCDQLQTVQKAAQRHNHTIQGVFEHAQPSLVQYPAASHHSGCGRASTRVLSNGHRLPVGLLLGQAQPSWRQKLAPSHNPPSVVPEQARVFSGAHQLPVVLLLGQAQHSWLQKLTPSHHSPSVMPEQARVISGVRGLPVDPKEPQAPRVQPPQTPASPAQCCAASRGASLCGSAVETSCRRQL